MLKTAFTTTLLLTCFAAVFGQTKYLDRKTIDHITDSIETEGKRLYRSEWASWYGTDIFREKCADKRPLSAGYISYETAEGMYNIFYSKGEQPKVLCTIFFGNDFNQQKYTLDTVPRLFTAVEKEYFDIRIAAIKRMETDTIFKFYQNTSLNPVPIIHEGNKKVYVLTGTSQSGVVLFGNDYLLRFNNQNEVASVKKLHNTLLVMKTGNAQDSSRTTSSFHSHVAGNDPFMTATDICTMMLYQHYTAWVTMAVISKDYMSSWDCEKRRLVILTMEAWDKINADQKTRHPKQ